MPKTLSTKISVADLEFVIEYLLVLSQSKRALEHDIPLYNSRNRIKLYEAAVRLEKSFLELRDQEFIDAINRVCADIEGIVVSTMPADEIKKLKTATRQKRYKNNDYNRLLNEYQSTLAFMTQRQQEPLRE